jgi:hypothetical protein
MFKRLFVIAVISAALFLPLEVLAENSTTREDRLAKAVLDQQLVLDDSAKALLQTKCQNSQIILNNIQDQTESLIRKRLDIYSSIQKDLQIIKLRMIRQGADASETDLLTGKIQQALDAFTLQADKYGTLLNDVVTVNCQQKPEQFKAGLVLMRSQRIKLLDLAKDLKAIVVNSDNDTFKQLKERLKL